TLATSCSRSVRRISLVPADGVVGVVPVVAAAGRSGAGINSKREMGLAILALSSTRAKTAETTCAGDCSLLNAVVLNLNSYWRPPAKRFTAALPASAGRGVAAAIGLASS